MRRETTIMAITLSKWPEAGGITALDHWANATRRLIVSE